jgi:hypothetical protein
MFNSRPQRIEVWPVNARFARVRINTPELTYEATIPATITTSSSTFKHVTIEVIDECFEGTIHTVSRGVTPSYIANAFNYYGFVIDALTGSMWKYERVTPVPLSRKDECIKDLDQH